MKLVKERIEFKNMKKSFIISLDSNIPMSTLDDLKHALDEISKIDGVEIDRKNLKIIYDSSLGSIIGKILDNYSLKQQS